MTQPYSNDLVFLFRKLKSFSFLKSKISRIIFNISGNTSVDTFGTDPTFGRPYRCGPMVVIVCVARNGKSADTNSLLESLGFSISDSTFSLLYSFSSLLIFEYWEFLFVLGDGSLNRWNSPEHSSISLSCLNQVYLHFHVNWLNHNNNQEIILFCWILA